MVQFAFSRVVRLSPPGHTPRHATLRGGCGIPPFATRGKEARAVAQDVLGRFRMESQVPRGHQLRFPLTALPGPQLSGGLAAGAHLPDGC